MAAIDVVRVRAVEQHRAVLGDRGGRRVFDQSDGRRELDRLRFAGDAERVVAVRFIRRLRELREDEHIARPRDVVEVAERAAGLRMPDILRRVDRRVIVARLDAADLLAADGGDRGRDGAAFLSSLSAGQYDGR